MKQLSLILLTTALLLTGCKGNNPSQDPELRDYVGTSDLVTSDMVNIDEISECEEIIADSSLMDGKGERAWTHKGTGMISIKNGDKYYLRMTTKDGNITAVTYRYIDK